MYLIDSNIFLEILLKQENKENCKEVLGNIAEGEMHAVVSKFTVHGIEGMLTEELDALDKFMTNITSLVNLEISDTTVEEEKQILEIAKKSKMDFDDALQYSVAKRENIGKIISYDTDFDNTDLKRVEPGELVE
jgi:predicted nucleic acid-binding protein